MGTPSRPGEMISRGDRSDSELRAHTFSHRPSNCIRPMSTSTVSESNLMSDGLSSLVLSKRYLACARPPHIYKLNHESRDGDVCIDDSTAVDCWPSSAWVPSPTAAIATAVQARYEPSDVFTPLVFEEIHPPPPPPPPQQQQQQQLLPPSQMSAWIRPKRENHNNHGTMVHQPPPTQMQVSVGNNIRRPLQHLPPPAQSGTDHNHQNGNNKPGDLSWLVNFQVASIFEPNCNGSTNNGSVGGNSLVNEWQEPETLKQKKKSAKTADQKSSSKTSRKPYRMPPSRLDKANKPGYTYTEMIHQALVEKQELPVAEIYQWISSHFPYFRENDERWKNSVRHNLSINPNFRKGRKSQGAGHYWRLCNTEESLGHREYPIATEDDSLPQESSELEQACKYLEGELQRAESLEDIKTDTSIDPELENEIYTNSFLISSPSKYVNEPISISNNNDFHSYNENLLEESIDFQYYNL